MAGKRHTKGASGGEKPIRFSDGTEMSVVERPAGPGDPLVMEFRLPQNCGAPPPHVHPTASETFEVTEGEFEMLIDGKWRRVGAGESVTVPPGQEHTFRNESPGGVVIRNVHDPHHDFEAYIRSVGKIAEGEDLSKPSREAMVKMAILWDRHSDLIQPSKLPMKIGFKVMSWLGRARGVSAPD